MGYYRAGFDVIGVDINPQKNYPFRFEQADALDYLREELALPVAKVAAIHASPPCQDHVRTPGAGKKHGTGWLLGAVRDTLAASGIPWAIENVPGAPMRADYVLCGCHFGLRRLKRQRWFETSWRGQYVQPKCHHPEHSITVTGTGTPLGTWKIYGSLKLADFREVMGIDWMNRRELSQAIPPAYTEHLGKQLLAHVQRREAA